MRRVLPIAVVAMLALVGACSAASSPSPTSAPTSAGGPVSATVTTAASTAPDPNLDPTTHARLHVVALDHKGPNVDLVVDGAIANNGGQAQTNVPTGYVTAYLYMVPGTHRVAVAPTGTAPAQVKDHVDVPVTAGHRYLVAFPAPSTGGNAKPLVIDETDAAAHIRATPTDPVTITLNALAATRGLDYKWAGKVINADIRLGEYGTGMVPAGDAHITVTAKGAIDTILLDEDNYAFPSDTVFGFFGTDPTSKSGWEVVDAASTTELNLIDSLKAFDAKNLLPGSGYPGGSFSSFNTVLAAIKTAGMTDLYTSGPTLLFLPPTDRAFAVLPQPQRDALLADPAALAAMLRSHTITGYVPRGSLGTTPGGSFDRSFKNLNGETIKIGGDFAINGGSRGGHSYWLANGTQVHGVDRVWFPPTF